MEDYKQPPVSALSGDILMSRNPRYEVTWEHVDPENPRTWPVWYRSFIVACMSFSTTIV
jgi:hypothetical protein